MKQSVNLRAPTSYAARTAGDEATRIRLEREADELRAAMTTDFAVAPRVTITAPDGTVLRPGDPVDPSMWDGVEGGAGWRHVERFVREGRVLERHDKGLVREGWAGR